jgi:hypothetical protein
MKNIVWGFLGVFGLVLGLEAQSSSRTLTINAQVNSRYKLETSTTTVTFTRMADPSTNPVIAQNEPPIQITVKATRGNQQRVWLRVLATADLSDGLGHTIPVGNISWTATGSGYTTSGTLVRNSSLQLGYWANSGSYSGTLAFRFQDNQNFYPAIYKLTVTLTLSPT